MASKGNKEHPTMGYFNVGIKYEQLDALDKMAEEVGLSRVALIRMAIYEYLQNHTKAEL